MAKIKISSLFAFLGFLLFYLGLATNFGVGVYGGGGGRPPTLTLIAPRDNDTDLGNLGTDGDAEGDKCALNHETRPQCNFSSPATKNLTIQIKCSAGYPVMWFPIAVEQLGFVRTSSRREVNLTGVASSGDLNKTTVVTSYSMSLHLSYNYNQTFTIGDDDAHDETIFVCGAIEGSVGEGIGLDGQDSHTVATEVTLEKGVATFRLVTPSELIRLNRRSWWLKTDRDRTEDPHLKLEFVSASPNPYRDIQYDDSEPSEPAKVDNLVANLKNCTVSCCVTPGAHPEVTTKHIRIFAGICSHPLACVAVGGRSKITTTGEIDKGLVRFEDIEELYEESDEVDLDEGRRCARWRTEVLCPDQATYYGRMFMCDIENGEKTGSPLPVSYLIDGGNQTEIEYASAWNETTGVTQPWEWTRVKPGMEVAQIHAGDTLLVRCAPNQFTFDQTIVWEFVYANGASSFNVSQSTFREWYSREQVHELKVPILALDNSSAVVAIVCHSAPWASPAWVSKSVHISTQPSIPPFAGDMSPQNVTFYTHELSPKLTCEFRGDPLPKLTWNYTSDVFNIYTHSIRPGLERADIYLTGHIYALDLSIQLPPVQVSCTGSNLGGSASHVFNVQAIFSLRPAMKNPARRAVPAREGETVVLNCTLAQAVPPTQIYWQRHGENVTLGSVTGGSLWSSLTLDNVTLEDEAEYECVAVNILGRATKEFSVRVRERVHEHEHGHTEAHADTTTTGTGTGNDNWIIVVVVLTISGLIALGFLIHYLKEKNFFSRLNLSLSPSVAWARFGLNRAESTVTVNTGAAVSAGGSSSTSSSAS